MSEKDKTVSGGWVFKLAIAVMACAVPMAAAAQGNVIEITPFIGYRWGGEIKASDTSVLDYDAEVDDASSYGLMVDFPVSRHFQIELLADRQETSLGQAGLFEPNEFGFDVDITYYQVGGLFQWSAGRARPYVAFGVGVADIDPDLPGIGGDTRASASLGGGIKVMLSENVAFRLELRSMWADTADWEWSDCDRDCHHHCDDDDCWSSDDDLSQHEIKAGITFTF